MWQSLPDIQQLPYNFPNYSTGMAQYHTYINGEGLSDGYGSNNYYPSPDETYYPQQYQGGWNSNYHY